MAEEGSKAKIPKLSENSPDDIKAPQTARAHTSPRSFEDMRPASARAPLPTEAPATIDDIKQQVKDAPATAAAEPVAIPAPAPESAAEAVPGPSIGADLVVINWAEAMEQVGDDEEFLHELLGDLFNETQAHVESLKASVPSRDTETVRQKAHSIKGAAANLMCHRLREAALFLEKAGMSGTKGELTGDALNQTLDKGLEALLTEFDSFGKVLKEKELIS
uniref:HPt domain-containing protein n=1 Tax=Fibrocapsa japonica TaxID=94617 RepID=A0A7S2XTL1_9STRA|mmetsp:Transcript_10697/g.15888  ORF Transcript_10697/g.15888 Transcript_10697/m.15888 type:complete len:220 (+) Transcript_10697:31-690(+)